MVRRFAAYCAIALSLSGCITQSDPLFRPAVHIQLTPSQQQAVMAGVARSLKDPSSAIFGPYAASRDVEGFMYVCGMVNSRNSYGGYVGMTPYFGMLSDIPGGVPVFSVLGFGQTEIESRTVFTMCRGHGVV